MTRVVSLLLAVVMVLSMAVLPASAAGFRDVTTDAWYAEAVDYVTARGYMAGTGEDTFAPNAAVTRAMFVTVLAKMAGAEIDNDVHPFEDVPAGTWYSGAVAWAAEQGIVSGTGAGKFSPNKNITRQDMSLILANFVMATGYKLPQEGLKSFTDADKISAYAREAVDYGTSAGLMSGYSDGTFRPAATATRAQLAVIVMALDKKVQALDAEPVPMPAQSFEKTASGIAVGVKAPVGAVPAGTELQLGRVTDTDYLDVIGTRTGADVIGAVDISFLKDGAELEPERAVEVEISMAGLEAVENPTVVHICDNGAVEYVNGVEMVATRGTRSLKFKAKDFSIYVIVDGNTLPTARATVNFYRSTAANAEPVKTFYVKNSDTVDELELFFTDPGVGNVLAADQLFNGWTIDLADANVNGEDEHYDTENYGPNYSATTRPYTIAQIRTYLANKTITGGETINIYAIIYDVYTVTYSDGTVTLAAENALLVPGDTEAEYTVSQDYTVTSQVQNFEGWYAASSENIVTEGENAPSLNNQPVSSPYPMGTKMVITGDVDFSTEVSTGHWLVFEENGYGAKYNAPAFIKQEEVTEKPCPDSEMTRPGYTFGGWYTDAACTDGNEFVFGNKITDRTVIYAKWIQNPTATYTVVIWKQNLDGDGYDFVEAIPMSGSTTATASPVGGVTANSCTVNGRTFSYTGFHLGQYDSDVTVKPAGGTIVNVRFDRNEYTLQFQVQRTDYTYTATTSTSETQYGLITGGQYKQLTRILFEGDSDYTWLYQDMTEGSAVEHDYYISSGDNAGWYGPFYWSKRSNAWVIPGTETALTTAQLESLGGTMYAVYKGTRYTRSNRTSNGYHTIQSITALYEQPIGNFFPIVGTNGTTYNNGQRWDPQTHTTFKQVLVYIDKMPADNVIFHVDTGYGRPLKTMNWMVEALPGDTNTSAAAGTLYMYNGTSDDQVSAGSMQFTQYSTISARYNGVTFEEDFIELPGFTRLGADQPGESRTLSGQTSWTYIYNTSANQTINFYYTRNKYKIAFSDGVYVDGRGNTLDIPSQGFYKNSDDIVYGSDISSYNKGGANYYTPTAQTGFVLEGWYLDETCTLPCTFDTMPLNGIQVYAKWRQIEYRVFLKPNALVNGARDTSLYWGTDSQATNFRIAYNTTVSVPTGTRNGYEFIGWYTDEALTVPYNKDTRLTDSTVPATPAYVKTGNNADWTDGEKVVNDVTEQKDMDWWGLIPDGYSGINKDADRFWITRKLVLYCKWSKVLEGSQGVYVQYDSNGGSTAPTDSLLYKESGMAVAQEAVKPADTENEQFLYWVMQTWDESQQKYVDVEGSVIYPGQNFIVDSTKAKVEDLLENGQQVYDSNGKKQLVYTIQLRAAFGPMDPPKGTHVIWYGNGGTISGDPATNDNLEDQYIRSDDTTVNAPIKIEPDKFKHPDGKVFIGWVKLTEGSVITFGPDGKTITGFTPRTVSESEVWLKFHPTDDDHEAFYFTVHNDVDALNGKEVYEIAADEKSPYDVMVAVWSDAAYYYVYHSATNTMEARMLGQGNINLQEMVTPGYLYGGYYKHYGAMDSDTEFDATYNAAYATDAKFQPSGVRPYDGTYLVDGQRMWNSEDAYTADGTDLTPQGSKVYCIKEVPESYLTSRIAWTYDKNDKNKVIDVFLLSVFDDKNYSGYGFRTLSGVSTQEAVYVPTGTGLSGADITTENHLAKTFQLVQRGADGGDPKVTIINSSDNFGVASGFISVSHMKALADKTAFSMLPFWVTPDGIEVTNDPVGFTKIADYNANGTTIEGFSWNRVYDGAEKIYVKISGKHGMDGNDDWDGAGAVQILYFYNQNIPEQSANGTYRYACAVASRTSTATIFAADVPAGEWTHVIIIRCKPGTTAENFSWDKKWTQTTDIAIKNSTTSNSRTDISTNYIKLFNAQGTYGDRYEWGIFPTDYNAS